MQPNSILRNESKELSPAPRHSASPKVKAPIKHRSPDERQPTQQTGQYATTRQSIFNCCLGHLLEVGDLLDTVTTTTTKWGEHATASAHSFCPNELITASQKHYLLVFHLLS